MHSGCAWEMQLLQDCSPLPPPPPPPPRPPGLPQSLRTAADRIKQHLNGDLVRPVIQHQHHCTGCCGGGGRQDSVVKVVVASVGLLSLSRPTRPRCRAPRCGSRRGQLRCTARKGEQGDGARVMQLHARQTGMGGEGDGRAAGTRTAGRFVLTPHPPPQLGPPASSSPRLLPLPPWLLPQASSILRPLPDRLACFDVLPPRHRPRPPDAPAHCPPSPRPRHPSRTITHPGLLARPRGPWARGATLP